MGNENIERTIYKLEIDGSAYIEGVDKVSASTDKLSKSQATANAKLLELQKTEHGLKKSLEEVTTVLKANEKETLELTKDLNLLKEAGKGTTVEANKLKSALRDLAVNTKEFKSEAATLKTNLAATTSQISAQAKEVKALDAANGNFTKNISKVYGGLSRIAQLIPGIGIGGLIALISGPLINAFKSWFSAANSVGRLTKDIVENAIKEYTKEVVHLGLVREKLDDLTIPQNKRIALAKDYNKTAEEGNKIDLKQIDNIDLINAAIDRQIAKIKQRALARAAENVITEKAEKLFLAQAEFESRFPALSAKTEEQILKNAQNAVNTIQATQRLGSKANIKELIAFVDLPEDVLKSAAAKNERLKVLFDDRARNIVTTAARELKAINDYKKGLKPGGEGASIATATIDAAQGELDNALKAAAPFITIDGLFTNTKAPTAAATNKIVNIYEQELQKLKADIAKLDEKGFTNEATLTKAIEEDFNKRSLVFEKALKNKQLTVQQASSLKGYLDNLQKLTLEQSLKSFREQKETYLKQITDELSNLRFEEATKRIATIQDSFERERQMIIAETDKTENAIKEKRDKLISDITKNAAKNGLTPADIAPQIESIKTVYSKLLDDLGIIKNQKLQQLSFDTFEKLSEDAKRLLDSGNLGVSQGSLINIKEQAKLLAEGKISFKEYQKALTEIEKFELNERFSLQKLFLQQEIKLRQVKLANDKTLTQDQIKRLQDEIRSLTQQLVDAEKGNVKANTGDGKTDKDDKIGTIVRYAEAIGGLIQNVIGFWQQANEAEQRALDRSISLQEKRVDAAQRIAARGNAQYLKQEEDRLQELNVKRENAARKQLGINAALQGSEILVALISGIAQGAKLGGPLGAIISVAAIAAAIAGAFAIAQSLQPPEQSFFVGTKDTGSGGNRDGKGGFNAVIHPHEAITPADKNKAYHPVIEAIHDGTIPAEHLNRFVKNYHSIKSIPQPNYTRIKEAAELSIGQDGRMSIALNEQNNLIRENNDLQRQTLRAMKNMSVSANIDKNGVAIMVNDYIQQMIIDKRT